MSRKFVKYITGFLLMMLISSATVFSQNQFDTIRSYSEGFAAVKQNGKWGFIDAKGTLVVRVKYDKVDDFSGGLANVWYADELHVVDGNGREFEIDKKSKQEQSEMEIKKKYEYFWDTRNGLSLVVNDGKYGVIDEQM